MLAENEIRKATTLADIRACASLMDESPWEPDDLLENIATDNVEFYIMWGARRKVIGFAIVELFPQANDPVEPDTNYSLLSYIYTAKRRRKSGLGNRLMQHVHDDLATRGYRSCRIQFNSTVPELYSFYTKIGYRALCVIHGYYTPTEPAWYMEYTLNPADQQEETR